ncbi:MAG TPA: 2-octaprenyl-6-methoxyphenyl hydroxylase [Steroidobacteraceae bacterium]|nr:2-octaprenyl-6-methoxyphenyl hydroxylase [Steroidobacteraceae bacterium]
MSDAAASGQRCDLAIVGGGLVGASLALALAPAGLDVVLIEAALPGSVGQPSFDDRTAALGNGSRRILETLGAWQHLAPHAAPIAALHVSDAGRFGVARLSAAEQGLAALGYTVSNRQLGHALWTALRERADPARLRQLAPARVGAVEIAAQAVTLRVRAESGAEQVWRASLAVAADGAQSLVRSAAGIGAESSDYQQVAIVANLATDRMATGVAFERFTPTGPLAVLPLADGSYTVVWTLAPAAAEAMMRLDDEAFRAGLQRCFGWRIGTLLKVGRRASYPLSLTRAAACVGERVALVGNAAQSLHPVAGQGFNLGLRDAATLAELVAGAADPGAPALLAEYQRRRQQDREGMIGFTDGLVRLFGSTRPGVPMARDLGLMLLDVMPPAKRALSRLGWGFGSRAPRLLRGLGL